LKLSLAFFGFNSKFVTRNLKLPLLPRHSQLETRNCLSLAILIRQSSPFTSAGKLILFGGMNDSGYLGDTWALTLGE
jgi:hypothetical protein